MKIKNRCRRRCCQCRHIHTFMTPKTKSKHLTKSNKLNEIPANQPIERMKKKKPKDNKCFTEIN